MGAPANKGPWLPNFEILFSDFSINFEKFSDKN